MTSSIGRQGSPAAAVGVVVLPVFVAPPVEVVPPVFVFEPVGFVVVDVVGEVLAAC